MCCNILQCCPIFYQKGSYTSKLFATFAVNSIGVYLSVKHIYITFSNHIL